MREIKTGQIISAVTELAKKANFNLRKDVLSALNSALNKEKNSRGKKILKAIIDNARIAHKDSLAICQDTGMPVVFAEVGQGVSITGGLLKEAITKAIRSGYKQASLRNSIILDPLKRENPGYGPPVIHTELTEGNKIKLTALPKGFGCENKSRVKMFNPTANIKEIKKFIINTVKEAGPDSCPPFVVGIGIGGTQDYACLLAKKALLKNITGKKGKLEKDLLKDINKLNIGPMGLGGKTTCLGVNILTYPTHIAGLPVAVNINCHALRSASVTL